MLNLKEEDINNLEKRLHADLRRLDSLNKNFVEDLKNFKIEINNDINNLLKLYKEMQINAANEVFFFFCKIIYFSLDVRYMETFKKRKRK